MKPLRGLFLFLILAVCSSFALAVLASYYYERMDSYRDLAESLSKAGAGTESMGDSYRSRSSDYFRKADTTLVISLLPTLLATLAWQVFVYRAWRSAGGNAGRAVLLQFVPIVHFYGVYCALVNLAANVNAQTEGRVVSTGLARVTAILQMISGVPFLGVVSIPLAPAAMVNVRGALTSHATVTASMAVLQGTLLALPGALCALWFFRSVGRALAIKEPDQEQEAGEDA